ncbi:MAG: hypothetical protein WCB94_18980 [Terriglobales bacterium]
MCEAAEDPKDRMAARDLYLHTACKTTELLHRADLPLEGARNGVLMQAAKLVRDIEGVDQLVALSGQDATEVA